MSKALFVGIEANAGHEQEVAAFLRAALAEVREEPDTRNWYALRFAPAEFAIFDTFPGAAGQIKHLLGKVGRALIMKSFTTIEGLPSVESAELLAVKMPGAAVEVPALALYVPLKAREGRESTVADFLKSGAALVADEPGTLAWYALHLGGRDFAIFDVFANEAGREAHLQGKVAAALMASAPELFEGALTIKRGEVLAAKLR
jgi:quinol monooxygenase YgiN